MATNGNGKPLQTQLMECQAVLENTRTRLADTEKQLAAAQADATKLREALYRISNTDLDDPKEFVEWAQGLSASALSDVGADAETLDTRGGA